MAVSFAESIATASLTGAKDEFDGYEMRIYGGSVPADVDTALGAQDLLATMELETPAFGAVSASGNDVVCQTPNPLSGTGTPAAGAGTNATFFRIGEDDGGSFVPKAQGSAGGAGSGADMILTQPSIVEDGPVEVTSITLRQARKA